jgi:hypothetical protein
MTLRERLESPKTLNAVAKAIWQSRYKKAAEKGITWENWILNTDVYHRSAKAAITAMLEQWRQSKNQALTNAEFARMERYDSMEPGQYTTGWLDCLRSLGLVSDNE